MAASPTPQQLLTESIIFWCIALVLFAGRLWSRAITRKSLANIQADDYVMIVAFICYTALLVLLQLSARYGTNEIKPELFSKVVNDSQEVANRIYGSKIVVGLNQCYLITLWGVKGCLLTLYYNMTQRTYQHLYVKLVIAYTVLAFIATEIPLFILCRPFPQYWALPPSNPQCATYRTYCIIQTVFNISSDILLLCIPIPLIIKVHAPPAKKAVLVTIFGLGGFVVLAATLNKYYNFKDPYSNVFMLWHVRETSTSVSVANLMCWWPLLQKIFGWRGFLRSSRSGGSSRLGGRLDVLKSKVSRRTWVKGTVRRGEDLDLDRTGSREEINGKGGGRDMGILREDTIEIEGVPIEIYDERDGITEKDTGSEKSVLAKV